MSGWEAVDGHFDEALVQAVRKVLNSGASRYLAPEQFTGNSFSKDTVLELFGTMVAAGFLRTEVVLTCPANGCSLTPADVRDGICPTCDDNFYESGKPPGERTVYLTNLQLSREIPWLIAVHGFNTHGEWQEDFSWTLATRFRQRAPVLVHKFPILRYGVLFSWRHRQLVKKLELRLRKALSHAKESGISEPPDILAHSFGTLLFTKLLQRKKARDLRFGRVILAGGIVRPDFNWKPYLDAGRVEAVFNHCSETDHVVRLAQFSIPHSGPSGRHGFDSEAVINYREKNFGHGTHFEAETMLHSLRRDGAWDKFLRLPTSVLASELNNHTPKKEWHPAFGLVQLFSRGLAIIFPWAAAIVILLFLL
jgi:hypothetical protein